jgi:hypothetical protein
VGGLTPAALVTLAANAIGLAVAFGTPIDAGQRDAILAFVGGVSSFCFAVYAAWHAHKTAQAVKLVTASPASPAVAPAAPSAPVTPGGGGG